jgi:hypothetical protein
MSLGRGVRDKASMPAPETSTSESPPTEHHPFLTQERIEAAGGISAALLLSDLSWIERRKDSIEILDDTALRRRISVDISLRKSVPPLLPKEGDEVDALYCAPVFVLPKSPGHLMSFDLEDETHSSLRLQSRSDNAEISGAALVAAATKILSPDSLESELERELRQVATSDPATGRMCADDLLNVRETSHGSQLGRLRSNTRFKQWLWTFGHSSLCVVLYRSDRPKRKLIRMSFTAPIETEQSWRTMLGWSPYRLLLDVPLLEARTFHFEATSPAGLRIKDASLSDTENDGPVRATPSLSRRVHLYRPHAQTAGAGGAVLHLVVGGSGFLSGAVLASGLTLVALVLCAVFADKIAANATSAPSLLLVLPGLIASYVARPGLHALTSRLLSVARYLLLGAAGCAYAAAGWVAFVGPASAQPGPGSKESDLLMVLIPLSIVAAGITGVLWSARARANNWVGRTTEWLNRRRGWRSERSIDVPVGQSVVLLILEKDGAEIVPDGYLPLLDSETDATTFVAHTMLGDWFMSYEVLELWTGSRIVGRCEYIPRHKWGGWATRPEMRRRELAESLTLLSERALPAGTAAEQDVAAS